MFIRLVVAVEHPVSRRLAGVFYAADDLVDWSRLADPEKDRLGDLLDWFNRHLPVPRRLARSPRPGHAAVCWFKADAGRHINRVRELAAMLERLGLPTRVLRTERPGYIVYEDAYQVVAVPFRDTGA